MTPEEKFWQLFMVPGDLADGPEKYAHGVYGVQILSARSGWGASVTVRDRAAQAYHAALQANALQRYLVEQTRLGIPAIIFEEGVHGLYQDGAAVFPSAIGLAATWDTMLVGRVATVIASEARARGVRQVLSPVVNVATDPRWGRVQETYGEDPLLSSAMAVAFVSPFERIGVVTTPKHFVANFGDGGRDSYPIDISDRQLEETYFPPFYWAMARGGSRSVMASYSSIDGEPATASRWLLTKTLRDDWHFNGVVIGDQAATGGAHVLHFTSPDNATSTKQAIEAGLDVIFQTSVDQGPMFYEPFKKGLIDPSAIDRAVRRVLRLKFSLGLFEQPYADPDLAARTSGTAFQQAMLRESARESLVLLRNESHTLPLAKTVERVAVIGADATEGRVGEYSPPDAKAVSILAGIREKIGAERVVSAPGVPRTSPEVAVVPPAMLQHPCVGPGAAAAPCTARGLLGEYFDNIELDGRPALTRTDREVNFAWTLNGPGRGFARDWYSARWTGQLIAPVTGTVRLGVEGNNNFRLWVDGQLVIDGWRRPSYGRELRAIAMERGKTYQIKIEYAAARENGRVKLVWDFGVDDSWRRQISDAVAAARASRVAVIVAGIEEGEFRDRAFLSLPGHQEELIEAVSATGTPVVVVLVGGSAITMGHWIDGVRSVLEAWYPGEDGGRAVADALFGDVNPGGRLPLTFAAAEGQLPLVYDHKPTGRGDDYLDLIGEPAFPFGFGLSYTQFSYSGLVITPSNIEPLGRSMVSFKVKNTGPVAGDEVVQLYLHQVVSSVAQPVIALKAFRRVRLAPNEERTVYFAVGPEDLALYDESLRRVVESEEFTVMIGASSRDIRLRGKIKVK
ncbi:MAG: glycoside hydrolase family 3 C-terminal domain-containing protein [Proteobacteria bacterium]|nr:glycoside hydrolase family 3 C-terminal domain-containing protein [Pseudomonadota bacterium]